MEQVEVQNFFGNFFLRLLEDGPENEKLDYLRELIVARLEEWAQGDLIEIVNMMFADEAFLETLRLRLPLLRELAEDTMWNVVYEMTRDYIRNTFGDEVTWPYIQMIQRLILAESENEAEKIYNSSKEYYLHQASEGESGANYQAVCGLESELTYTYISNIKAIIGLILWSKEKSWGLLLAAYANERLLLQSRNDVQAWSIIDTYLKRQPWFGRKKRKVKDDICKVWFVRLVWNLYLATLWIIDEERTKVTTAARAKSVTSNTLAWMLDMDTEQIDTSKQYYFLDKPFRFVHRWNVKIRKKWRASDLAINAFFHHLVLHEVEAFYEVIDYQEIRMLVESLKETEHIDDKRQTLFEGLERIVCRPEMSNFLLQRSREKRLDLLHDVY